MPRRIREVVVQYEDETEEVRASLFTSDQTCEDMAERLAHQIVGAQEAYALGYGVPDEVHLITAVIARGLDAYPHIRAWYPATMAQFRMLDLALPAAPEVHDYRTSRGKRIREEREEQGLTPWNHPTVKALAARFHWPAP